MKNSSIAHLCSKVAGGYDSYLHYDAELLEEAIKKQALLHSILGEDSQSLCRQR